jgi:hypothetical protein
VSRLEQRLAATGTAERPYGGVVIVPQGELWSPPPDAPEDTVWVLIPDNKRDQPRVFAAVTNSPPPTVEELPPWRDEII